MFYALVILLHRPFVSEGHLKSVADLAARDAFSICETAAAEIDVILRWYKTQFCIKSPPYFLSYATYVSATIHVRSATHNPKRSKAHQRLRNCLEILSQHQDLCHAPRRSMSILLDLVKRLNVDVGTDFAASTSRAARCEESRLEGGKETPTVASLPSLLDKFSNATSSDQAHPIDTADQRKISGLTLAGPAEISNTATGSGGLLAANDDSFRFIDSDFQPVSSGLDELLPDMYFDFDPLFGFDISQMDTGADSIFH